MNIRRFRALHEAGASYAEIAAEAGCDWRTVKKYLAEGAPAVPPAGPPRKGTQPRKIAPFAGLIDGWLRADITLRASVICERLTAGYGYAGSYQRVKMHVAEVRPKIAAELAGDENPLAGLHRRFEVLARHPGPGRLGRRKKGDRDHRNPVHVYSFHMTLSFSRDPFSCFVSSQGTSSPSGTAIAGRSPTSVGCQRPIVYDRTKTVVKRHVEPGRAGAAPPRSDHRLCCPLRLFDRGGPRREPSPQWKGRVERQVPHRPRARPLWPGPSPAWPEMDTGVLWTGRCGGGREVHRTHGEVIGVRAAADHRGSSVVAGRPLRGLRAALALPRQGLPGQLCGQPVLGAGPAGAAVPAGAGPGRGRQGCHLRAAR